MRELKEFYKDKKVLITGHTGFKGSWLVLLLLNLGAKVVGYSLEPKTKPNPFNVLKLSSEIRNYIGDIRNFQYLKEVIQRENPEIIFHLAAQPLVRDSYDDPLCTFETNTLGSANVLQAIRGIKNVKSVVMITTDKVYENKEWDWAYRENDELGGYDPYSSSKACAELVIKSYTRSFFNPSNYGINHNVLIASARAGNVIGGGDWSKDRIIPDIIKSVYEINEKLIIRSPQAIRPWQFVLEPLLGYLILGKYLYEGQKKFVGAWNFSPEEGNFITVKEIVENALRILNKGSYDIKEDNIKHETKILKLDATKAKNNLNWKPLLNIEETLEWTFKWYKTYYENSNVILDYTNKQIEKFLDKI